MKEIVPLLFITLVFAFIAIPVLSQEARHLNNKHTKEFEVECSGCHEETPPAENVNTGKCEECHGTLMEIGQKTISPNKPNPHINHNDELYCEDCHHIHKKSDNYCITCHGLKFDVP